MRVFTKDGMEKLLIRLALIVKHGTVYWHILKRKSPFFPMPKIYMKPLMPPKLKPGDGVRVIAPSLSLSYYMVKKVQDEAVKNLKRLGLKITYGRNAKIKDIFQSSSIKERVSDFHDAFRDPSVRLILAAIGGYNSNQLLDAIDYRLVAKHPKIIMSHSDGIALLWAIYSQTGLITYSGPTFYAFGEKTEFSYTRQYIQKALFDKAPYKLYPSQTWTSDHITSDQSKRKFIINDGYWIIQKGKAQGVILGDNLCTLQLLQGTKYWPSLKDSVLFLEDDGFSGRHILEEFDRNLESLTQQSDFRSVRGIVIGRFNTRSDITKKLLTDVIKSKNSLNNLPIVANVDFGHTSPRVTLPIGGTVSLELGNDVTIEITKH